MSKTGDDQTLLTKKGADQDPQEAYDQAADLSALKIRNPSIKSDGTEELRPPEKLNTCQWVIIAILYLIFAFLAGFIIYISATWNKDRTNEYT